MFNKSFIMAATLVAPVSMFVVSCNEKVDTTAIKSEVTASIKAELSTEISEKLTAELSEKLEKKITAKIEAQMSEMVAKQMEVMMNPPVSMMLAGKAVKMEDGVFIANDIKEADYYLFYFTASWCEPCRKSVSQLVQTYNAGFVGNDKVELILMSDDRTDDAALIWSKKESFPWPQVMAKNVSKDYSFMKYRSRYVPQYLLINREGEKVAEGLDASLQKLGIQKAQ